MRKSLVLLVLWFSIRVLYAQESHWERTTLKDPLSEKSVDRLALTGEYLVPPAVPNLSSVLGANFSGVTGSPAIDPPRLVLLCSNGKLIRQYGVVASGSLTALPSPPVAAGGLRSMGAKIDFVVDGGRKKTVSAGLIRTTDRDVTGDASKRQYLAFELDNILPEIMRGKFVTLVARDDFSLNMTSTVPPRQVLMEFHMPDRAPLMASCGEDRAIRGAKP